MFWKFDRESNFPETAENISESFETLQISTWLAVDWTNNQFSQGKQLGKPQIILQSNLKSTQFWQTILI